MSSFLDNKDNDLRAIINKLVEGQEALKSKMRNIDQKIEDFSNVVSDIDRRMTNIECVIRQNNVKIENSFSNRVNNGRLRYINLQSTSSNLSTDSSMSTEMKFQDGNSAPVEESSWSSSSLSSLSKERQMFIRLVPH